ncbi:hydroxymethylbilane synthase [Alicyclobacillus herbarius]|uniref:hydroxymethylbilane synthase n=1 Tax=Alicyclobacillus herbarius TaxID=122960 RepID=UPI0004130017|nr:hydroxymethylbilane synthase [Alicyclobacillus herbarius]
MRTIRVASRRSRLALTQTQWVIDKLKSALPDVEFEVVPVVTKGDRVLDVSLTKIGGKGLFVSEVEQTLLERRADFAVHSLKDVPAELASGLVIAAMPAREDPSDALLSRDGTPLDMLPARARIGTSSLRRAAQLRELRPDVEIVTLRGNIDTRLKRLQEGDYDAIVLAAAGLSRMGWSQFVTERLPVERFIPAVGQGILAIECREDDTELREWLRTVADVNTEFAATAERAFLARLGGSCQVPMGAFARLTEHGEWRMTGMVAGPDGQPLLRSEQSGRDPRELGLRVAEDLLSQGAGPLIELGAAVHG